MPAPTQAPLIVVPEYPRALTGRAKRRAIEAAVDWYAQQMADIRTSAAGREWQANRHRTADELSPTIEISEWQRRYIDELHFDTSLPWPRALEAIQALDRAHNDPEPQAVFTREISTSSPSVWRRVVATASTMWDRVAGEPPARPLPPPRIYAAEQREPLWITDPNDSVSDRRKVLLERITAYADGQAREEFRSGGAVPTAGRPGIGPQHHVPIADALAREIRTSVNEGVLTDEQADRAAVVLDAICRCAQTDGARFSGDAAKAIMIPAAFDLFNVLSGPASRPTRDGAGAAEAGGAMLGAFGAAAAAAAIAASPARTHSVSAAAEPPSSTPTPGLGADVEL